MRTAQCHQKAHDGKHDFKSRAPSLGFQIADPEL
jgi:hypothetical protein